MTMPKSTVGFLLLFGFALASAAAAAAQAQAAPEQDKHPERTITSRPSTSNPTKAVDETDRKFMQEAAIGNEAEIQLGQMAQQKSSNPAVKAFGERMIKDHSNADDKLKNVAASQHISLPTNLDPEHQDAAARLSKLSGKEFDQAYMQLMVQEHTKDVDKFKTEASAAHDDTVKQFAAATLPVLESHLNEAQQIAQQLKSQ